MSASFKIEKWITTAVSGIRFAPDREAVQRELRQHMEDKVIGLMDTFPDMEEKEAQERALAGMGDPEEIKEALARVHTPWLGYLWTASRLLVWAILAAGLLLCLAYGIHGAGRGEFSHLAYQYNWKNEMRAVNRALFENGGPSWEGERLALYEVDAQARLGRAELSVPKAARWREGSRDRLYLQVRVTWDRPWEQNEWIFWHLWAEDDMGNRYLDGEKSSVPCRGWEEQGTRTAWINLYLEDFPSEAAQVRLHSQLRDDLDLIVNLDREAKP